MLYDLDFLDPGNQWPPPPEKERLDRYEGNRQLYEADHDQVFGQWFRLIRNSQRATLEIILNFPRRLSDLWATLLVGEPPSLAPSEERADDEEAKDILNEIASRGLYEALRECSVDRSRFGDGLLKVRQSEEGALIEAISPELWFPVVSRANIREINYHVLAWTIEESSPATIYSRLSGGDTTKKTRYLYVEIHSEDAVEYRLHHIGPVANGSPIGMEASDEDKQRLFDPWVPLETHKAGGPLVIHIPNPRSTNRLYGYDDYKDIEGLVMAMEVRLAQHDMENELHGNALMAGPPIVPPEPGSAEADRVALGERYIQIEPNLAGGETIIPEYVQRDINVSAIEAEMDRIEKWLYIISHTSPTAFGVSETGYAESGTALSLRMQNEEEQSSVLRIGLDDGAKIAIERATALEGSPIEDADIGWKDGLPTDIKEQTEIEVQRVDRGLTSKKRAIMRLYDMSEDEAEEELERIREEAEAASMAQIGSTALDDTRALIEGAVGGNGRPSEAREEESSG